MLTAQVYIIGIMSTKIWHIGVKFRMRIRAGAPVSNFTMSCISCAAGKIYQQLQNLKNFKIYSIIYIESEGGNQNSPRIFQKKNQ